MKICYLEGNQYALSFQYDAATVNALKVIPQANRSYSKAKGLWYVSPLKYGKVNQIALDRLDKFLNKNDFKVHNQVWDHIQTLREKLTSQELAEQSTAEKSRAESSDFEVNNLCGGTPRPYQRAGIEYLVENKRVILGDEMGLGKTIQGIGAVQHNLDLPCLVVCPPSLLYNWKREIEKWSGRTATLNPEEAADYTIVPYSKMKKYLPILKRGTYWKALIADEAQNLKNWKSQRTQATAEAARGIENIYLLTGTPIKNKNEEWIAPLRIIRRLDEMGGWDYFTERYCGAVQTKFGIDISRSTNSKEFNILARSKGFYVRRKKADVLKELPDKQRLTIEVDIDNRREYESQRKIARQELIDIQARKRFFNDDLVENLEQLDVIGLKSKWESMFPHDELPEHNDRGRLMQGFKVRLQKHEAKVSHSETIMVINKLKQCATKGKMKAAKEWINDFLTTGEKLIIFSSSKYGQRELYKEYQNIACPIFSNMKPQDRQASVDCFQENPNYPLIISSLLAGGVGYTMTAASTVFFLDQGWTPPDHDQAEDRAHRIGQENAVTAYYLLGRDTIDFPIYNLIGEKRAILAQAADGDDTVEPDVAGTLMEKLALNGKLI